MLLALVVAGIGLPLGRDAPVGSSIEVGGDTGHSAIGADAWSIALLHRLPAKESSGASRDGDRSAGRDRGGPPPPADTESTTAPTELALSDPAASATGPVVTNQAPAVGAPAPGEDSQGGSTGSEPSRPNTTDGAAAAAVRGALVDQMLDVP
jgi:hypothetical protein